MLRVSHLSVWYHKAQVITDVSLRVDEGSFVSILGPNGAGKTTLLRSVVNLHEKKIGLIEFLGEDISREPAHRIARRHMTYVPDYRGVLKTLTVRENLQIMKIYYSDRAEFRSMLESTLGLFPHLEKRYDNLAALLSGGEQQMLSIARALLFKPRILLIDEPSIGLAPLLVSEIFRQLRNLTARGMSVLMVEQNVIRSLEYSDYCYVMEKGKVVLEGNSKQVADQKDLKDKYFGNMNGQGNVRHA